MSLGIYERFQLEAVVETLRKWHNIGIVALWGRSMGAATAVLFAQRNSFQVTALVRNHPKKYKIWEIVEFVD